MLQMRRFDYPGSTTLRKLFIAAAFVGFATTAIAQTAEETVLFVVLGYEKDNQRVTQLFRDQGLAVELLKLANCKYKLNLDAAKENMKVEAIFDFTNLTQHKLIRQPNDRFRFILTGSGLYFEKLTDIGKSRAGFPPRAGWAGVQW